MDEHDSGSKNNAQPTRKDLLNLASDGLNEPSHFTRRQAIKTTSLSTLLLTKLPYVGGTNNIVSVSEDGFVQVPFVVEPDGIRYGKVPETWHDHIMNTREVVRNLISEHWNKSWFNAVGVSASTNIWLR